MQDITIKFKFPGFVKCYVLITNGFSVQAEIQNFEKSKKWSLDWLSDDVTGKQVRKFLTSTNVAKIFLVEIGAYRKCGLHRVKNYRDTCMGCYNSPKRMSLIFH